MRIATNGFGRIGRQVLRRIALAEPGIEVAAVNSIRAEPAVCALQHSLFSPTTAVYGAM